MSTCGLFRDEDCSYEGKRKNESYAISINVAVHRIGNDKFHQNVRTIVTRLETVQLLDHVIAVMIVSAAFLTSRNEKGMNQTAPPFHTFALRLENKLFRVSLCLGNRVRAELVESCKRLADAL